MDRWLDNVARGIAGGVSRRQALRRVGLGIAGLLVASAAPNVAQAKKKDDGNVGGGNGKGKGKGKGKGGNSSCAHFCKGLPPGKRGKCVSDAAHKRGLCYDCGPKGDNSGLCGQVCCDENFTCTENACVCAAPYTLCGTDCVDLTSDIDNCGACGTACADGQTCSSDGTGSICCDAGFINCGGTCTAGTVCPP